MPMERSYGKIIIIKDGLPKLLMLNSNSEEFTILAEPLIRLVDNQKQFLRIKRRDRQPEKAKGYPGEIYGYLTSMSFENNNYYRLTIYIGEGDRDIKKEKNKNGEAVLQNIVNKMRFYFPLEELDIFAYCIKTMVDQHDKFKSLRNYYVLKVSPGEGV